MNRLQRIEKSLAPGADRTTFTVGDTVRVHVKVVEGGKERIQVFEGAVIARSGETNRETFTVRKVSYNTGVERIFPVGSPKIEKIEVVRHGRVRRAKLYFLRERRGKRARIAERDLRGRPGAADEVFEDVLVPGEDEPVAPDMDAAAAEAASGTPPEAAADATTDTPPDAPEKPAGETGQAPEPERAEAASGTEAEPEPTPDTEKKDAG